MANDDQRDLALLAELARQSKRRMFILGVVIVLAGALSSASAIVVATTRGERVLCYVVSVVLVALGAFLAGIARRSARHLLGLMPRVAQGEGVVWLYIDAREIGGGSQLLHIVADDGAEHAMVLSAGDISSAVAVLRERVPTARFGEDTKLRERFEADRVGVARELAASQAKPAVSQSA